MDRHPPRRAAVGALTLVLMVAGCSSSGEDPAAAVSAVATTTQIGDWVREVGGDAVSVTQILQPNTDPHDYEPRPDDVTETAAAQLVFANGDNLDSWVTEIVAQSGSDASVVDLGSSVPVKRAGESSGAEASEFDPHWWHDPRNAVAAVRQIQRRLQAVDPADARSFADNADDYVARLRALDQGIQGCIDEIPRADRVLVTDHDAFGYFADRYGLRVIGTVIPSQTTQAQPSAKDVAELSDLIEAEGVRAVFPESSVSPDLARAIAEQTGASADYTLYGDTLGPADSPAATYLSMEEANADAIVQGLTGGARGCEIPGLK